MGSIAERWTCSFCALRCDDLQVAWDGEQLRIAPPCKTASQHLAALTEGGSVGAQHRGQATAWDQAMAIATDHLRGANAIRVEGPLGDIALARATIELAESWQATLRLDATPGQHALAAAIAREGVTSATFGDLRLHADRVVFVGDVGGALPRFGERFAADKRCLRLESSIDQSALSATSEDDGELVEVGDWTDWLREVLLTLREEDTAPCGAAPPHAASPAVARLLQFLRDARYVAFVVSPTAFSAPRDHLAAEWLLRLVERLGRSARCVLLTPDASAAGRNTLLWRTGFAGAVQFSVSETAANTNAEPNAEPGAESGADGDSGTAVAATPDGFCFATPPESGVTVRIAPTSARRRPPAASGSGEDSISILIGDAATTAAEVAAADLFLPAAWPGIDFSGTTVRGDGSVTLPLRPLPHHRLPAASARSVLELLAALRRTAI